MRQNNGVVINIGIANLISWLLLLTMMFFSLSVKSQTANEEPKIEVISEEFKKNENKNGNNIKDFNILNISTRLDGKNKNDPKGDQKTANDPIGNLPRLPAIDFSSTPMVEDPDPVRRLLGKKMPLDEKDIEEIKKILEKRARATTSSMATVPIPIPRISTRRVDLTPGAVPQVLRVSKQYGGTVNFIDTTGRPWPMQPAASGKIEIDHAKGLSLVFSTPSSFTVYAEDEMAFTTRSITVVLKDLTFPIILTVIPNQPFVDASMDLVIPLPGPNADKSITSINSVGAYDSNLIKVMEGVPDAKLVPVKVTGVAGDGIDVKGWLSGKTLYLAGLNLVVLSPAPKQSNRSSNGYVVYSLEMTPIVFSITNGIEKQLLISEISVISDINEIIKSNPRKAIFNSYESDAQSELKRID